MFENLKRIGLIGLALACLLSGTVSAEAVKGDLSERFDDIPKIEYEGENYILRNQLTTILLMGILTDETSGKQKADFIALLVVDDDERKMSPIQIDSNLMVESSEAGGAVPLCELYPLSDNSEENCLRLVDAVNGLLGEDLINYYAAFELEGMAYIDGVEMVEGDAETQLRALKSVLEQKSLEELTALNEELADYIITDMKSGALAKVMDKSERYERPDMVDLPVKPALSGEDADTSEVVLDETGALEMLVPLFYTKSIW